MAQGFGYQAWLGLAEESTYGTAVASAKYLELLDESLKLENPIIERPTLRQLMRFNQVPGKRSIGGAFKIQMPLTGAEYLIDHALGVPQSLSGAGPYVHTWNSAPAQMRTGLTLQVNRDAGNIGGNSSYQYSGCQISKLSLVQEPENFLEAEFEVVGKDEALISVTSPSFPTFSGFHWASSGTGFSCTLNSVATAIKRWELSIENALADDRFNLGTRTRVGLGRAGQRKISGSVELEYSALTQYNLFAAQTSFPLVFDYNISASNRLLITLPACYLKGNTPNVSDSGPIPLKLDFDCYSADGAAAEISIVLTNSTTTY